MYLKTSWAVPLVDCAARARSQKNIRFEANVKSTAIIWLVVMLDQKSPMATYTDPTRISPRYVDKITPMSGPTPWPGSVKATKKMGKIIVTKSIEHSMVIPEKNLPKVISQVLMGEVRSKASVLFLLSSVIKRIVKNGMMNTRKR